jgi:LCP family protein required for cell wall assembly
MKPDKTKLNKLKRRLYKYLIRFRSLIYIFSLLLLILILIWLAPKAITLFKQAVKGPKMIISLINPSLQNLDSFKDRTNILLLGIAGDDNPGADLTDSIILASINLKTSDAVIISLPRDIWVESLQAKLNTAYHYGEEKKAGSGLILAESAASEIINQPIHYGVLLNFSGFEQAIDTIGGIKVNVPRGFIDEKYPIPGQEEAQPESARYEKLEFFSGEQLMNGPTALKYVRSRNAPGEEGTDYARAQRQQRVILAFKDKIFSLKILLNPSKLKTLHQIFKNSVKTDFPSSTYPDLAKLASRIDRSNIRTGIIDQGSQIEDIPALLYNPPASLYGQWVLLPINDDWQAIYQYIEEILYQNQ